MTEAVGQDPSMNPGLPAADRYRTFTVATEQGPLSVGEWVPHAEVAGERGNPTQAPIVLAIHGVTGNHRAWPYLAAALPQVRILAPDLRGRGGSAGVGGPYGMRTHAEDMRRVLDAREVRQAIVVGHSMGGFVTVVTAALAPDRVSQVVLVDGGIPLTPPPENLSQSIAGDTERSNQKTPSVSPQTNETDIDAIIDHITSPIAARLQTQFSSMDEVLAYWNNHPAFAADSTPVLADYARYDLGSSEPPLQSRVSMSAMKADSKDLLISSDVMTAVHQLPHPTHWITVERGLQNETPGLYSHELIDAWRQRLPHVQWRHVEDINHYTIVMSERGAGIVADVVLGAIGASHARQAGPRPAMENP